MNRMFFRCKSLLSLPDISKWDISKVDEIPEFFYECEKLEFLPNISK